MAGRGRRFIGAGIGTPKMLIPVRGRLMIDWALDGLSFVPKKDIVFVVLREHDEEFRLGEVLRSHFGGVQVCAIPGVTQGQACTVAAARSHYSPSEPIAIFNTDTYFSSPTLEKSLGALGKSCDGVIGVFRSASPDYSYASIGKGGLVARVEEKNVISEWATSGLYAFSRASDFLSALDGAMLEKDCPRGEYYVGPLYNRLIAKGARIAPDRCSQLHDLGTPEKLKKFEAARLP